MFNTLKFTQNSLVLITYLLIHSNALCLSWTKI